MRGLALAARSLASIAAVGLLALSPSAASAQASAPTSASVLKHDAGTIRTLDAAHGLMICEMPDGPVTYDVTAAQVFDAEDKPAGAASALKVGDKVQISYALNEGAKVVEIHLVK